MKILAISLLRIGDLILHEEIIENIKSKYPQAKIDLLINDVSEGYSHTIKNIRKVFVFDRGQMQKCLVEFNRSSERALKLIKDLVFDVNKEKYDLVINLTHTQLSAKFMDLVNSSDKSGMFYLEGVRSKYENNWARFFNEYYSECNKSPFQYYDLLCRSLNLDGHLKLIASSRDRNEERSAKSINYKKKNLEFKNKKIALQVLTSDSKKNWGLKNFLELAHLLKFHFSDFQIVILGSRNEEVEIRKVFAEDFEYSFDSWDELGKTINSIDLLITGDTSVQHFAAKYQVPTLSLFLGSANPYKTAPRNENAYILQSIANCSPCHHSEKCSKESQICADFLPVETVYQAAFSILTDSLLSNKHIQNLHAKFYRVVVRNSGFSRLEIINQSQKNGGLDMNVQTLFEQLVWQIYLDQGHLLEAGPYGSSSYTFLNDLASNYQLEDIGHWLKERVERNENDQLFLEEIEKYVFDLNSSQQFELDIFRILQKINSYLITRSDTGDYFYQLKQTLKANKDSEYQIFVALKNLKKSLIETKYLLAIEHKLNKAIQNEIDERSQQYVAGIRKASHLSFAST